VNVIVCSNRKIYLDLLVSNLRKPRDTDFDSVLTTSLLKLVKVSIGEKRP
jgi:hypothetical protein